MASNISVSAPQRRKILTTLTLSLLLDLISFTLILPLFPSVLDYYRSNEDPATGLLCRVFQYLKAYRNCFSKPVDSAYDILLLGGAFGSLFSLLQAFAAPFIGRLSDKYGRRKAMLYSMAGNILSVSLWAAATDFRTFIASRIVGGLSEGNVQLANAIIADISSEADRGPAMAFVGACFSLAFTCGPLLGAALAGISTTSSNKFAMAAYGSLTLIAVETVYIYFSLPETLPRLVVAPSSTQKLSSSAGTSDPASGSKPLKAAQQTESVSMAATSNVEPPVVRNTLIPVTGTTEASTATSALAKHQNTQISLLNAVHFCFLLPFSGLEFSLPFFTAALYTRQHLTMSVSPAALNGRLLSLIGLVASILQGTIVRRLSPHVNIRIGVIACSVSFFLLANVSSIQGLYGAAVFLAVTSATTVTGINSLGSLGARECERGAILGRLRSWGQAGRAMGPLLFCSLFWWAGKQIAYLTGGTLMLGVAVTVFTMLKPHRVGQKV